MENGQFQDLKWSFWGQFVTIRKISPTVGVGIRPVLLFIVGITFLEKKTYIVMYCKPEFSYSLNWLSLVIMIILFRIHCQISSLSKGSL